MKLYILNGSNNMSGRRIKEARQKAGLTQEGLAIQLQLRGLQVSQMAVSRMEKGKRVIPDFELPFIADALGVSVLWLLNLE